MQVYGITKNLKLKLIAFKLIYSKPETIAEKIYILLLFINTLSRAACTFDSLRVSSAEVASSKSRIVGFLINALAIAILCF